MDNNAWFRKNMLRVIPPLTSASHMLPLPAHCVWRFFKAFEIGWRWNARATRFDLCGSNDQTARCTTHCFLSASFFFFFSHLPQQLTGPTDHSYFDKYPPDDDSPPDELSGWDVDF